MRRAIPNLALVAWAFLGLALAQPTFEIGLGETRTGTIPTDEVDHRYVLTLPAGVASLTIAVTAGGDDADMAVAYLPTGEQLYYDISDDPDPTFTLVSPRAGSYEILVKNLLWQPLVYALTTSDATAQTDGYFVAVDGAAVGPLSRDAVIDRIARGATSAGDLVWRPGLDTWMRADAVPELASRFVVGLTPPPLPPPPLPPAPGSQAPAASPPASTPPGPGTGPGATVGGAPRPEIDVAVECVSTARDGALGDLPVGGSALVTCPPGCSGDQFVWGSDLYTDDSSVCRAAIHAGLVDAAGGGSVVVTIRPGASSYEGSVRNDVGTRSYGSWGRSFGLAPGTAAGAPGGGTGGTAAGDPNPGRTAPMSLPLATLQGSLGSGRSEVRHVVTVDRDGDLQVRATAGLNVVLHLYGESGATLASSTSGYATTRSVQRVGLAPGTYTVAIARDGGSSEGTYTIDVELQANTTRDDEEPNDAAADARPIPSDAIATGRLGYGNGERTDTQDWFLLTTEEDGDLSVTVEADPTLQIVLHLHGGDDRAPLASHTSNWSNVRTVAVQGLARGRYLLLVSRDGSNGYGGYAIAPTHTAIGTRNDVEPNDTRDQAQAIGAVGVVHGRLGYGDGTRTDTEDHFLIATTQTGELRLSVHADLNVVLYLTDANGSTVATDTSGYSTRRTLSRAALPAGRYVVRIARDGSPGRGGYVLESRFTGR